MYFLLSIL
uniref:Uncharacterized protein n=1 Tax=Anguilla anguilla TaxID=7936 RepID=A0A0E9U101_ANGAN